MSIDSKTTIFISDLHLGDGTRADDFHRKKELLALFDLIDRRAYNLIIVGDLFELWQSNLDKILSTHSEIIARLIRLSTEKRLIYLIGNHDYLPYVKYVESGLGIELHYKDSSNSVWAEHGNQHDIFNRHADPKAALPNKLGRFVAGLGGWLERIVHPDIDEWVLDSTSREGGALSKQVRSIRSMIRPSSKEYIARGGDFSEYEFEAEKILAAGYRIVVFGHTHRALLKQIGSGLYANCGTWCGNQDPTYVKLSNNKIELVNGINHSLIKSLEL